MLSSLLASILGLAYVHAVPLQSRSQSSNGLFGSNFGLPQYATYDYVVVGGGNAGLTIAARLAQDRNLTVAVIEAGSFYEIENGNISQIPAYDTRGAGKAHNDTNRVDWGFTTAPQQVCLYRSPGVASIGRGLLLTM